MGIPSHIKDARQAIRKNERLHIKRAAYVKKFGELLYNNKDLRLPLKKAHIVVLERVYDYGIRCLEERIIMTCASDLAQDTSHSRSLDLEKNMKETEYRLMAKFLDDLEKEPSPDYDDDLGNTDRGIHDIHQALSTHHGELLHRIDQHTLLLEDLAKYDEITESDEEYITLGDHRPEKTKRLLEVIASSPPNKNMIRFLEILEDHHEGLGEKVNESMRQLASEPPDHLCAACTVVTMIDPSRIAKKMFDQRNIPGNFYRDLTNPNTSNDKKWRMIRRKGLEEEAIYALRPKFQHYFNMFTMEKDLTCTCKDSVIDRRVIPRSGGSSGRHSGTSSFKGWSKRMSRNTDGEEVMDKLIKIENSVEDVRRLFQYHREQQVEPSTRATSTPDVRWPYHTTKTPVNKFPTPTTFHLNQRPWRSQLNIALDGKRKTKTKRNGIFNKIKNRFSSANASAT